MNHWSRPPRSVPGGQWARNVPFFDPEVDVDVLLGLAEELHDGDRRDRELAGQLLAFELRPARADDAGHRVLVDARRVQRRLGRVADPDRPLVDLDPGRRPLVGRPRRGPGAEAERGRQPGRSDRRCRMGRLILPQSIRAVPVRQDPVDPGLGRA